MATQATIRKARLMVEALEDRQMCANWSSLGVDPGYVAPEGAAKQASPMVNDGAEMVSIALDPSSIGSATGGAGAGKIKFNEFTIKKTTDKASPAFFKNCCAGAHYKNVTIDMRKAGGDPTNAGEPFLQFKFDTVFTTKIDWSGPGDEGPEESITFVYGKLGVNYWPGPGDEAGQKVRESW